MADITGSITKIRTSDNNEHYINAKYWDGHEWGELASALKYCGITTTKLTDGATTNPVVIGGKNHTATAGCVVFYEDTEGGKSTTKEFVFNGSEWELLGADSTYKVIQSAVSSPNADGSALAFIDTISQDANGVITVTKKYCKKQYRLEYTATESLSNLSQCNINSVLHEYDTLTGKGVFVYGEAPTSIIDYVFRDCTSLTSLTIPDSVTSIGYGAFEGCTSLTSITIPDSVTSIGDYAFSGCTSLTSLTIPDSVTSIGYGAFEGCTSLTSITIPDSVTSIGEGTFVDCTSLTSVTIPNSVTLIEDGAFYNCTSLTEIAIPNSVPSIGYCVFQSCTSLTEIAIPNSVTSIIDGAFMECSSLTNIIIGNNVDEIGYNAFYSCTSLTNVYCKPTTPPMLDSTAFNSNASGRKIYVPIESVGAYKAASGWSEYADDIVGCVFEDEALVSGVNIKTINGESILGEGDINLGITPITWGDLVALRDNGMLVPGHQYRIIDYVTTTVQPDTKSAGHQFDIIVTADDKSTLNEVARACLHEGDTYFSENGANLEAWQIWYCLDNDTNRFAWVQTLLYSPITNQKMIMVNDGGDTYIYVRDSSFDSDGKCAWLYDIDGDNVSFIDYIKSDDESLNSSNIIYTDSEELEVGAELEMMGTPVVLVNMSWTEGKGVIYRMIDEWNNDCPYDFKNIQFLRGLYADGAGIANIVPDGDEDFTAYCYTFGWENEDGTMLDTTIFGNNGVLLGDVDQIIGVYGNIIKENIREIENSTSPHQHLNNIVFLSTYTHDNGCYYGCYNNSFGNDCNNNSFGNYCNNNSFGKYCDSNSFGNDCNSNSFGNGCTHNSFGNDCNSNSFGNGCNSNSFGNGCYNNSFENGCSSNSFRNDCFQNSFGNSCYNNTFGNDCDNNSFGNKCSANSLGDGCSANSFGNDCTYNSFENDCTYNSFENDCDFNTFGNDCDNNSFGNKCYNNSFLHTCYNNSFGNNCYHNSFRNDCYNNTFGNECNHNSLGDDCSYNSFGNKCYNNSFGGNCSVNSFGNYCIVNSFEYACWYNSFGNNCYSNSLLRNHTICCHFDDKCEYINLSTNQAVSSNYKLQNININRGVKGTASSNLNINIDTLNSEKEINVDNVNGYIYILEGPENVYKTTYENLVNLRDNSQLIPGLQYRIIDYITTTSQENTKSANHQFDIIVTAIDDHTLSEDAKAAYSENDTYFEDNNVNLSAWELKYSLDNDTDKFAWAGDSITMSKEVEKHIYDSSSCTINPELIDGNEFITHFSFESCVWVDANGDGISYGGGDGGDEPNHDLVELIYEWGYFTDDNGKTQLCLYKSDADLYEEEGQPDYGDKYLYRGVITVDGTDYDYWQKWDAGYEGIYMGDCGDFVYATTHRIVTNPENLTEEITTEIIETTIEFDPKGVIYYMKDEWNNECPYDFKNIMFIRYKLNAPDVGGYAYEWQNKMSENINKMFENNHLSYIWHGNNNDDDYYWEDDMGEVISSPTGETKAFFTFSNVVNDSVTDKSITSVCHNNIIKEYGYGAQLRLNNIVFFSTGITFDCNSNSFGNECHHNSFGNACGYNSFGNECYDNSFGNGYYSNSFGNACGYNSFGNECYDNSFGNQCYDNSFGNNCNSNRFVDYGYANSFGDNCYSNSFDNYCNYNSFGNDCYYNSFGNECHHNSFGNECHDNSFGDYCYSNGFGRECNYNSFGNECNYNSFCNNCYDNSFGNNCNSNRFVDYGYANSFGDYCYSNSFDNYCNYNSFGNNCYDNSFGNSYNSNSFSNDCYHNSFGKSCGNNSFGNGCISNSFDNYCNSNSFGNVCVANSFGDNCNYNSFDNDCYSNSFGNNCYHNSFGNYCWSNSFGNNCRSNSFGNNCDYIKFGTSEQTKDYYRYITVESGNTNIYLSCTGTTSTSKYFQNIHIGLGVNNTSTYKTIANSEVGQTYETKYVPANSQVLSVL